MSHHSHYYDHDPKAGHDFQDILFRMEDHDFLFRTDRAVFSRERVDPGTALLLSSILKEEKDRPVNLLDLGTGVGVMALVLARLRPSFHLTGIDVNRRALDLAAFNARRAGLSSKVSFLESDGIPQGLVFDLIISNPPIRAGKETVYRLFGETARSLSPQGVFYLVIRVKQGAGSAKRELGRYFGQVSTLARAKGYHVIKAQQLIRENLS